MSPWNVIAAVADNRVIGQGSRLPWHLPEDFRWFKQMTLGGTLVMGRRTFEAIGRLLPGRTTVVLSQHGFAHPGVRVADSLDTLRQWSLPEPVFICGGAQVYALALPCCLDLYLTRVKGCFNGDAFFPEFEDRFVLVAELRDTPAFKILHYRNRRLEGG